MSWLKRFLGQREIDASQQAAPDASHASDFESSKTSVPAKIEGAATAAAPDLVDGLNALAAYYRYIEAQAFDAALKSMRARRDFREEFLRRLDVLLSYADDETAVRQIQLELDKESASFAQSDRRLQPLAAQARALDADGYRLLGLATPLTWDSLKAAYRGAALLHHPDVGGDNETMRRVNDAYGLFSALLKRQAAEQGAVGVQPGIYATTTGRFFANVKMQKFWALVDDLAADQAFDAYRELDTVDVEQAYGGADSAAKLAELLAAAGKPKDASSVLHDLGKIVERAAKRELNYGPIFRRASEACCDPKHIRFIPNHIRQADNLLRLAIIDRKRYDAIAKRIGNTEGKLAEDSAAFAQFVRSRQFLALPMDDVSGVQSTTELVPAPDYSRAETLTDAQHREYVAAYHGGAAQLAQKYLPIRLDALLRSPFRGFGDVDAVLQELRDFESAPGFPDGLRALCECGVKVVAFLAALSARERARRIELLSSFDCDPRNQSLALSIGFDGRNVTMLPSGPAPKPIFLNPQFAAFATESLVRLERYGETGSELTPQEQQGEQRDRERRQRDWEKIRAFHESDVYKRARDAAWSKDKDPESIVRSVLALCEEMYRHVDQTGDDSQEIGYWTDKLTVNLVKLKRYDEALRWITRFESGPEAARMRTTPSVADAMRKRRIRCEAAKR